MNCQDFNGRLHEYLDETLEAEIQAEAHDHLRQCGHCRQAIDRELALAKSLRQGLDDATASLELGAEARRKIREALEAKPVPANAWLRAWLRFIAVPLRPIGVGAALLAIGLLLIGILFHRRSASDADRQTAAQNRQGICVVDVPMHTQIHVLRWEGHTLVDRFDTGVTIGRAQFQTPPSLPHKPL